MKKIIVALFLISTTLGCSPDTWNKTKSKQTSVGEESSQSAEKSRSADPLKNSRLEETVTVNADGQKEVTNADDVLVVANKERNLPKGYKPKDLVIPDVPFPFEEDLEKKMMRKEAAEALETMFKQAKQEKVNLFAQSGYRSFERQKEIFASNTKRLGGLENANKVSAQPGQSEHQTGLSMDVTSVDVQFGLVVEFEDTIEGKWVEENAHKFGFIIRYEKGKENITGYDYEPWHIRYVGKEHAQIIKKKNITLEEYLTGIEQVDQ